jgi:hypothetical protein
MKYTNKRGFPDFVYEWLITDFYDYDENTLSATTLMQPARAYALKKQNWDRLEIDVEDLIASRYGTAIHDSVEKVKLTGCKQEERLKKAVKNKIISGKFDILKQIDQNRWELIDVKSTSVWTYIYGSRDEDYRKQLSIYRWLAIQNKYEVIQKAKIWMIFTDWSSAKAKEDPEYPQTRIMIKEIDLWGDEETLKYIGERIDLLEKTAKKDQSEMPECTDEELWTSGESWAVQKKGAKRATKVHKTEIEAKTHLETIGEEYETVHRPGKVARCRYCAARKFCNQHTELVEAGRIEDHDN